jgi:translation initiation factor IF-1
MSNFKGATHQKKHGKRTTKFSTRYELVLPNKNDETELYTVERAFGDGKFQLVNIETNGMIKASITRSFKKGPTKEIISTGDTVLVQPGISKNQYFIIHRYSSSDIEELQKLGIVSTSKFKLNLDNDNDDDGLDFDDTGNLDNSEDLFDNL